jgi:histidinol dehydrogenase
MSAPRRLRLAGDGVDELVAALRPPPPAPDQTTRVAEGLAAVRELGDAAIVADARAFGAPGFSAEMIAVPRAELDRAAAELPADLRAAIEAAASQVRAVARAGVPGDLDQVLEHGQRVRVRQVPVAAAGCYVPGGRAAYPSSLVMAVVPAQAAGVGRVAVVSPPGPSGRPSGVTLGAASLLGVEEVYAAGGVPAIGALAFGTATIPPVDVIAGPGNSWVQEAKRQVVGAVGVDSVSAGPSEVVAIADGSADPRAIALDLLAQAEHGPDSPAILLSAEPGFLDEVEAALGSAGDVAGVLTLVDCDDVEVALGFAEAFAPEHLQLNVREADGLSERVTAAGAVFLGPAGGTAFGDYVAGSNHILPTGGTARFASAVGPGTYLRRMSVVTMTQAAVDALTPHLAALADAEGFPMHRASAEIRTRR